MDELRARVTELEEERDRLLLITGRRGAGARCVSRYVESGWRSPRLGRIARRLPNPLFDPAWYVSRYPDVPRPRIRAWLHWRRHGWCEGRNPNPLFDTRWYLATNPDVQASGKDPLDHYLRHGASEGRDPGPMFDSGWYLRSYPDVGARGMDPLLHYLLHGAAERRPIRRSANPFHLD